MGSDRVDQIISQVFRERSLLEKLCFKGGKCVRCGDCAIPGAVKNVTDVIVLQNVKNMNDESKKIASIIDHTLLKPCAVKDEIIKLCNEAEEYSFASVCVNLHWVKTCAYILKGTMVKICSVVDFPFGATSTEIKVAETEQALTDGANEIDMVINIGELKSDNKKYVLEDINQVALCCKKKGALLKVIIETGLLTDNEKVVACLIAKEAGADFVKTSTGFNCGGAIVEDVALMRKSVGSSMGVKASGGIKTLKDALAMIKSGANRIGTSSGVKIVREAT